MGTDPLDCCSYCCYCDGATFLEAEEDCFLAPARFELLPALGLRLRCYDIAALLAAF